MFWDGEELARENRVISMHLPYMKGVSDGMAVPTLHQAGY
jgi:hypothetical protein